MNHPPRSIPHRIQQSGSAAPPAMPPLQFQPLASQPSPAFWSALNNLKLDKLKLDDAQQPILGWIEEGRQIVDREAAGAGRTVGVDGALSVGGGAFGESAERRVGWGRRGEERGAEDEQTIRRSNPSQGRLQELQHDRGVPLDRGKESAL